MPLPAAAPVSNALRLVRDLRQVTERMLEAAKNLDSVYLDSLVQMRNDRLFELRCALEDGPIREPSRTLLKSEFLELRRVEVRLERVSQLVLHALRPLFPAQPVATYGRAGTMSAGGS